MATAPDSRDAWEDQRLRLQRMESRLVDGLFEHPGVVTRAREHQLRYAIGLAALHTFQPGAARRGRRNERPDVTVRSARLTKLRRRIDAELAGPLLEEGDTRKGVLRAAEALDPMLDAIEKARAEVLERHRDDFSELHLDQEVGRKSLVNIAGGGGGAAWVYLGAWEVLQNAGLVPSYLAGASMGAILALFRALTRRADFDEYVRIAESLRDEDIFRYVSLKARFGLPGLTRLYLSNAIGHLLERPDGDPLRLGDLEIPFDVLIAGIRRGALDETPEQYAVSHHLHEDERPSAWQLRAQVAAQLVRLVGFVNPRIVKEIVVGRDALGRDFEALDAVGFSSAIPGVLHYDMTRDDPRMEGLLDELMTREDIVALVDGGVANNVPCGVAWRQVQDGRIGTRNAYVLAFDSFHPNTGFRHLYMQPITRVIALQVATNDRYAHQRVEFRPTLSPIDLTPTTSNLEQAVAWGRQQMAAELPRIQKFFERVRWVPPKRS